MSVERFDVAIMGGGLAGNLLARQLSRDAPDASVLLVEKSGEPRWKVGESTVEVASDYFVRKLGLSTYIYDQHLPKYGLRYFFDTEGKDASLTTMSEIGTDRPPPSPSFQLDRARLEPDLLQMNREAGIDVRVGVTVRKLGIGEGDAPHRLGLSGPDGDSEIEARWVIDGTGRTSTIARQEELRREITDHGVMSVWGRFEGVRDFDDDFHDEAWRRRTRYIARTLSTNHFLYPGYWIWFIPLGRGVTSIGVVGLKEVVSRPGLRTEEGFRAFLEEHRAVSELLDGAKSLDVDGFTQLAYGTERFLHPNRWALLGDAAAFPDPFYSPGSDFIAIECDFVTDLVKRDLGGEAITDRLELFERFMHFRYEATMLLYRDLYGCLGSYDLMQVKLNFDLALYYNVWLDAIALDQHLDEKYLTRELSRSGDTFAALTEFSQIFQRVNAHLRENGSYFDGNLGNYDLGVTYLLSWLSEVGTPRKRRLVNRRTFEVFERAKADAMKLLGEIPVNPDEALPLSSNSNHGTPG